MLQWLSIEIYWESVFSVMINETRSGKIWVHFIHHIKIPLNKILYWNNCIKDIFSKNYIFVNQNTNYFVAILMVQMKLEVKQKPFLVILYFLKCVPIWSIFMMLSTFIIVLSISWPIFISLIFILRLPFISVIRLCC